MKYLNLIIALVYSLQLMCQTSTCEFSQIGEHIYGEQNEDFGNVVSISDDGTIIAVGARQAYLNGLSHVGLVSVYKFDGGTWNQLGQNIEGDGAYDLLGQSVCISGDGNTLVVGAPEIPVGYGYVRVYRNINNNWVQIGEDLTGEDIVGRYGFSVSINSNGNIIAIGAPLNNDYGTWAGLVNVFKLENNLWEQLGQEMFGLIGDNFGWDLELNSQGDILAVGSPSSSNPTHADVYRLESDTWTQIGGQINGNINDNFFNDYFGASITINDVGDIIAVGAYANDNSMNETGYVKVLKFDLNSWVQVGSDLSDDALTEYFGSSVALNGSGNLLAIGAVPSHWEIETTGYVQVYELVEDSLIQIGDDILGDVGDNFGNSVDIDDTGGQIAISSNYYSFMDESPGHVLVINNTCSIEGCTDAQACNYNVNATIDDSSCWFVGQPCDDNDDSTFNDVIQEDCTCSGVVGVQELSGVENWVISPNPSNGIFNITGFVELPLDINIVNQFGKLVFETTLTHSGTQLKLMDLTPGVYFVTGKGLKPQKLMLVD